MIFVLDSSESVIRKDPTNWQKVLNFVLDITHYYTIGPNGTKFGVVLYSDEARLAIPLTSFDTRPHLANAILNLPLLRSYTDTFAGLHEMRRGFAAGNGDRENVPNVAILIADSDHSPGLEDPLAEANRAHLEGITILAIGLSQASAAEVANISSSPQQEDVTYWLREDFNGLQDLVPIVQKASCELTGESCTLGNHLNLSVNLVCSICIPTRMTLSCRLYQ